MTISRELKKKKKIVNKTKKKTPQFKIIQKTSEGIKIV